MVWSQTRTTAVKKTWFGTVSSSILQERLRGCSKKNTLICWLVYKFQGFFWLTDVSQKTTQQEVSALTTSTSTWRNATDVLLFGGFFLHRPPRSCGKYPYIGEVNAKKKIFPVNDLFGHIIFLHLLVLCFLLWPLTTSTRRSQARQNSGSLKRSGN